METENGKGTGNQGLKLLEDGLALLLHKLGQLPEFSS